MIPGRIVSNLKGRLALFVHFDRHDPRRVILETLNEISFHSLSLQYFERRGSALTRPDSGYHVDVAPQTGGMAGIVSGSSAKPRTLGKEIPKHVSERKNPTGHV